MNSQTGDLSLQPENKKSSSQRMNSYTDLVMQVLHTALISF